MARALCLALLCVDAATAAVAALPPKTLQFDVKRVVNQTAYGAEFTIGTPPQKMRVNIDSGSPFLGLAGTNSNWCQLATKPCAQYGSYDNTTSSTAKYINDEFSNELINHGFGDYIQDTVRLGGQDFPNIQFGMILDYLASFPAPDVIPGLVGLVPFCLGKNNSCRGPAVTFEQALVAKGYVHRHTVGLYLGPDEPTATGQILFGAVDRAKQVGMPVTFPVIPLSNPIANQSPNLANFSSVGLERSSGSGSSAESVEHFNISKSSYGILDSGNPNWDLPTPVWKFARSYFGLQNVKQDGIYYPVDCKYRKTPKDNATLIVGFDSDKLKIRIPVERLVTQLSPGHCGTAIQPCDSDGVGCAFGDPFLRSTYTWFDFDNTTVTMSNVRYTNKTDIVAA